MLKRTLLCVVASSIIKQIVLKKHLNYSRKPKQGMLVNNVEKSNIFIKTFLLKLKNAEDTVITVMVKTSFKYLISLAICVDVLKLLDLFCYFWLI